MTPLAREELIALLDKLENKYRRHSLARGKSDVVTQAKYELVVDLKEELQELEPQ